MRGDSRAKNSFNGHPVARRSKLANYIHPVCVRLWQMRKEKCITLNDLAKEVGYSSPTISKWETGHRSPSLNELDNWAQALQFTVDFKLEGRT